MPSILSTLRSRLPVLLGVAFIGLLLLVGTRHYGNLPDTWRELRIPSEPLIFADGRMVLYPIDCVLQGQDPYDRAVCHVPLNGVYNYPPIWLDLRYLGLTSKSSIGFGLTMVSMFIMALLALFSAERWISALFIFLGVIAQAPLLAVERGNIDLSVFAMLILGMFLIDRFTGRTKQILTGLLVGFLTVLKVFPIVAASIFMRNRRGWFRAILVVALSVVALVATSGSNLPRMFKNTPQIAAVSYGAFPFFYTLSLSTFHALAPVLKNHRLVSSAAAAVLACCSIVVFSVYRKSLSNWLPALDFEGARGRIAVACLAIYCFTFLQGASFDYRLIFLLGVLGFLVSDLNTQKADRSVLACAVLVCFLWMPLETHDLARQIMDGIVFTGASGWLGSTLLSRLTQPVAEEQQSVAAST